MLLDGSAACVLMVWVPAWFSGVPAMVQGTCVAGADRFAVDVKFQTTHADVIAGINADRYRSADCCSTGRIQDGDGRCGGVDDCRACCG